MKETNELDVYDKNLLWI